MKTKRQKVKALIVLFLCLIFLYLLFRIVNNKIIIFDKMIYNIFYRNNLITSIMKMITFMGDAITLITLCIIVIIVYKNKKWIWTVPLNLTLITIVTQSLKFIIKRPRPSGLNLIEMNGYSFPSGHTTSAVAFYGFLIYLIYKKCHYPKLKKILIAGMIILIIIIGISRIYLGVHHASDVLAGFAISLAYLIIYTFVLEKKLIFKN